MSGQPPRKPLGPPPTKPPPQNGILIVDCFDSYYVFFQISNIINTFVSFLFCLTTLILAANLASTLVRGANQIQRPPGAPVGAVAGSAMKAPPRAPPPIGLSQTNERPVPIAENLANSPDGTLSKGLAPPGGPPGSAAPKPFVPKAMHKEGGVSMFEQTDKANVDPLDLVPSKQPRSEAKDSVTASSELFPRGAAPRGPPRGPRGAPPV